MKIVLNAEPFGYSSAAMQKWPEYGYIYRSSSWDEITNTKEFTDVQILIVRLGMRVEKEILNKFPNLKILVSATTGLDHLDLNEINSRKIKLLSLKGQNKFLQTIPSTAEHTWALIMALVRNIPHADRHVQEGGWSRDQFRGWQLMGKHIGIIGLGRTGSMVASFAVAFGMKVFYYDPYVENSSYNRINNLNDLLSISDVISFHVHLSVETENLLNEHNICFVKKGSLLINTSRGKVWNEVAVAESILPVNDQKPIVRGVATDVLETELTNIGLSPLWQAQKKGANVLITPHIGGATWDAMWSCEEFMLTLL